MRRFSRWQRGAAILAAALSVTPIAISQERETAVLVGAGDIASCHSGGDERTAALLDAIPGTIFTTGDNAYSRGSKDDFRKCFEPSWGRHRARIRPAPGNHDYDFGDRRGSAYHDYFGAAAGPRGLGYYEYELGTWQVIVLNSTLDGSAFERQRSWLAARLKAGAARCTIAYWHHPLFSSGEHSTKERVERLWRELYASGAEIVLNGHDHIYERFAPQNPDGIADDHGIREFIVGTGGGGDEHELEAPAPNSERRAAGIDAVLKLELRPGGYRWELIGAPGSEFSDSGEGVCHGPAVVD